MIKAFLCNALDTLQAYISNNNKNSIIKLGRGNLGKGAKQPFLAPLVRDIFLFEI